MAHRLRTALLAKWRREATQQMVQSRIATLRFLMQLPRQEILRPRTQGKWSIKDILAHIVAWEGEGVHRLTLVARGRGDRIKFYDDMREVDRFNARAVAAARLLSLPALLRRAATVRLRLIEALRRLPHASLNDPTHEVPVVTWLREFAWTHERAHMREIRAWWKERRAQLTPSAAPERRAWRRRRP